jgi:oxygen-dependent protoporphyrinogen oxidase
VSRHVVVVGGGIAGLTAALRSQEHARVALVEAADRVGGKIRTEEVAGRPLDVGAEALLTRTPAAIDLCRELGLPLVAQASDQAYVWTDRLRPLPPRLLAGAPGASRALVQSGILSPLGLARASLDLVIPARRPHEDVSIGALVRGRLGDEVLERLIDPLLGGIHAGSCDELSVRATAPQLEMALQKRRSLVRGLRAIAPPPGGPLFMGLEGGLETLVHAIAERLDDVRAGTPARAVAPLPGGGLQVDLTSGESLEADHVIVALPSYAAAELLGFEDTIRYQSVATIALSYPLQELPPGSGFLVPRGRTLTACTWSSQKWAHLAGETTLLKCSTKRTELADEELIAAVRGELAQAGVRGEPQEARVFRFERALPQYTVGHRERVRYIEERLPAGVRLCGAAYHGVGVAACVQDGAAAAAELSRLEADVDRHAA